MDRIKSFSPLSRRDFLFRWILSFIVKESLLIRFLGIFRRFTDANSTDFASTTERNHKIAVQYTSSAPGGGGPGADAFTFDLENSKFLTFSKEASVRRAEGKMLR